MQGNNNFNYVPRNNQFSSYFKTPVYPPLQEVSTSTNNIVWVQGIEGAKAWQLNPNSMIILLDSEAEGKMYIKVSDNIGMSSLRIFNYTEEVPNTASSTNVSINSNLDLSNYVTKDELIDLVKEVIDEQSISTVANTNATENKSAGASIPAKPKVIYTTTNISKK